jgi:hypothetical protein
MGYQTLLTGYCRLIESLAKSFVADPTFTPQIVSHVGIPTIVEWIGHVGMMGVYGLIDTAVAKVAIPIVDTMNMNEPRARFEWRRRFWQRKGLSATERKLANDTARHADSSNSNSERYTNR